MSFNCERDLRIIGGSATEELTNRIATELGVNPTFPAGEFASGEIGCEYPESVREADVFIIQSHCGYDYTTKSDKLERRSPQDALMEHLIMVDAAKTSWAGRVIAVSPYVGYGRQDRLTGRQSITASLAMRMFEDAGADGMVSIDMHSAAAEGLLRRPFEHLTAAPSFARYIKNAVPEGELIIVSPDSGRIKASKRLIGQLGKRAGLSIVDKERNEDDNGVVASEIIGADVEGKPCFIFDDMIDGGGTITASAQSLKEKGATKVTAMATHGVFSAAAKKRFTGSAVDTLVVSDTIPLSRPMQKLHDKGIINVEVVSIAGFLAKAIRYIHEGKSVQKLHPNMKQRI